VTNNGVLIKNGMWDAPILSGSFNNWEEPQKMVPLREFAKQIDRKKPEYMQSLVDQHHLPEPRTLYSKLSEDNKVVYQENLPEYVAQYEP
jgi:hypothetical protein